MIHRVQRVHRRAPRLLASIGLLCLGACTAERASTPEPTGAPSTTAVTPADVEKPEQAAPASPTLANAAKAEQGPGDAAIGEEPAAAEGQAEPEPDDAVTEPRKVLILGDSLAATGFGALLERKLDEREDVVCYRKGKSASGLARPDFFDWMEEAKKQIEFRSPDLVIVIMGGNDGQDLTPRKASGWARVGWQHETWAAGYRERVDAFLAQIAGPSRKVLWVGLPTMGLRSLEKKLELIRGIQREAVLALGDGATYLDTAPFVTTQTGELLTHAQVGGKGSPKQLRAEDRIHFTMSGSEYFADAVYPQVLDALGLPEVPPNSGK